MNEAVWFCSAHAVERACLLCLITQWIIELREVLDTWLALNPIPTISGAAVRGVSVRCEEGHTALVIYWLAFYS